MKFAAGKFCLKKYKRWFGYGTWIRGSIERSREEQSGGSSADRWEMMALEIKRWQWSGREVNSAKRYRGGNPVGAWRLKEEGMCLITLRLLVSFTEMEHPKEHPVCIIRSQCPRVSFEHETLTMSLPFLLSCSRSFCPQNTVHVS